MHTIARIARQAIYKWDWDLRYVWIVESWDLFLKEEDGAVLIAETNV